MDYAKLRYDELLREEEKLKEKMNDIEDQCLKEGLSFSEFEKKAKKEAEGLYFIDKYKRLRAQPTIEYGKEWRGDYYTIENFKKMVQDGMLVDYDGYGYYATVNSKSDIPILPSDVTENIIRDDFTHVIWFGR